MNIKLILFIVFTLTLSSGDLKSQTNTFNWTDTTFKIGSSRDIRFEYDFQGPCSIIPCYHLRGNAQKIEMIDSFLKQNPKVQILITYYMSSYYDVKFQERVSEQRTREIRNQLAIKGILNRQISCKSVKAINHICKRDSSINKGFTKIMITDNELPTHIKAIQKDTSIYSFYDFRHDFFYIKESSKPISKNQQVNQLMLFLEKLLDNDQSYVVEIKYYFGSKRYSTRPKIHKFKTEVYHYFDQNKVRFIHQLQPSCTLENNYIPDKYTKGNYLIFKLVENKKHQSCLLLKQKRSGLLKKIDKCKNCPF